jgi:hypothetical protein
MTSCHSDAIGSGKWKPLWGLTLGTCYEASIDHCKVHFWGRLELGDISESYQIMTLDSNLNFGGENREL